MTADVIANMCAPNNNQKSLSVIDAGDGKGYLSTRLSLEYDMKVLGVDCNPVNTRGAQLRSEKLEVRNIYPNGFDMMIIKLQFQFFLAILGYNENTSGKSRK